MAVIVLVHGIDQQQKSADRLENEWLPDLAGGVRIAGFPEVADRLWRNRTGSDGIDARMAFYGHLFLQPDQMGDDPGELTAPEEELAERLAEEWLQRAARRASHEKEKIIAERELAFLRGTIGDEPMGTGAVIRKAVQCVARVSWFAPYGMAFAERFVRRSLAQVSRYLTDQSIRHAARQAVLNLIGPETQIVVAHSLGSVVAYETVSQMKQPLPLFLTIGSPLGLETIIYQRLEPQPPIFPPLLRRWVNVADHDDIIATEPDLSRMFSNEKPADAIFESEHTVDCGAEPHNASFYLGKAEVGEPIGEVVV